MVSFTICSTQKLLSAISSEIVHDVAPIEQMLWSAEQEVLSLL